MLMHSPFDIMAETYDSDFTHSEIGQLQRKKVWQFLSPVISSYQRKIKILELNCGTGEDALELARLGHSVTATDASEKMIQKSREKAELLNRSNIRFETCSFEELHQFFNMERFDLVISNFGGLNCINKKELTLLSQQLSVLTEDSGKLFLVIMSRRCLWEIFYFSVKGKWSTAFRRMKRSVMFSIGENQFSVFYYSPENVKRIFAQFFTYIHSYPVGLLIPPSYLEKTFLKHKHWLFHLSRWENKLNKYNLFSNLADHFCIILQKKGEQ